MKLSSVGLFLAGFLAAWLIQLAFFLPSGRTAVLDSFRCDYHFALLFQDPTSAVLSDIRKELQRVSSSVSELRLEKQTPAHFEERAAGTRLRGTNSAASTQVSLARESELRSLCHRKMETRGELMAYLNAAGLHGEGASTCNLRPSSSPLQELKLA